MGLNWNEIKSRALLFSKTWADACNEDSQAKPFWIDFFEIFGITNKRVATFELHVKKLGGAQGFVDLFWPGVLLVEHKSRGKNLDDAVDQAIGYLHNLSERDLPQLVVVCDFARFRVRRLASGKTHETVEFELKHLHKHVKLFGLLAGYKVQDIRAEDPVNIKAAERMGRLHDALKASGYTGHALEVLLVRLLFCLFADDTGIFQPAQSFRDFIEERTAPDGSDLGPRLGQLFQVLNTHESQRNKNIDEQLGQFAYINGRLFEETLPMADFSTAMREALLDACGLDWSAISPAIFGSLFQSIMDEKARRNLGAHYTSEANILKLIKPLFLDELHAEFERVKGHRNKLFEFHKKLRQQTFFDPACGCGNFLVISYRELRELELKVLRADHELSAHKGQLTMDVHSLIRVNVDQFFGIEIEEFPAQIAQVALWLVDHQMNLRVSVEFGLYFARVPLISSPQIRHGNALQLDWNDVLPAERCSYVLGNPPFIGHQWRTPAQAEDMSYVWGDEGKFGRLDFVTCWHKKTVDYMKGSTMCSAAFVSTNSICQGEQVGVLWSWMLSQGADIHFAHKTFAWSNEAKGNAAVHCVIIGFKLSNSTEKTLFEYEDINGQPHVTRAQNINPYLLDAPNVILPSRADTPRGLPQLIKGSQPTDGGHLILTDPEKEELTAAEPNAEKWIRPYVGGVELINSIPRWCLWLKGISPAELRAMPKVLERVKRVTTARTESPTKSVRDFAAQPTLFTQDRQPTTDYLAIPEVSSANRRFIPIAFLTTQTIASNKLQIISNGSHFHFGILSSTMHNAWMRTVCGRMKSDYSYSPAVYNNYPWPGFAGEPLSEKHRTAIEQAAQCVLDTRAQFADASLADLYDPLTMPPALLKAHQKLDTAVDAAYQPSGGKKTYATDAERVAFLFELYQRITSLLAGSVAQKKNEKPNKSRKPDRKKAKKMTQNTSLRIASSTLLIQLSDIHFTDLGDAVLKRSAQIAAAVQPLLPLATRVILIVTGDIAQSGKTFEYDLAKKFIRDIALDIKSRHGQEPEVITVPGNHDADFDSPRALVRTRVLKQLKAEHVSNIELTDVEECIKVFEAYEAFAQDIETGTAIKHSPIWRTFTIDVDTNSLQVHCVNNAWSCEIRTEPGSLGFPTKIHHTCTEANGALRILLMHHPAHWIASRQYRDFRRLTRDCAEICFTGHEHESNAGANHDKETGRTLFVEGGVLQDR